MLPYGYIATKHPVPDRIKPSFIIFDIRALLGLSVRTLRVERQSAWMSKITNDWLNSVWDRMLWYSCTHMATVDVKGL